MQSRHIAGNVFLVVYSFITLNACLVTIVRFPVLSPRNLILFSYGMMAPYQSYGIYHEELLAEGQTSDGTWEVIDLAPYYPVLFGERNVREFLAMYRYGRDAAEKDTLRTQYAERLLTLERARGHIYTAVRFSWQTWPNMTGDFHQNKFPAATDTLLLLEHNAE